ncbi:MAG: transcription-repair coupling factor [Spirochaetia bacterium]|nr:transcription-repair coupling factor [Spirochaetia bacterium]
MDSLKKTNEYKALLKSFTEKEFPLFLGGLRGVVLASLTHELLKYSKAPFLFVFPTDREAQNFCSDYNLFEDEMVFFPSWETIPYSGDNPSAYVSGSRVSTLSRLISEKKTAVSMSQKAFLTYLPEKTFLSSFFIRLKKGKPIISGDIGKKLEQAGYLRVPRVSIHGEFALRGEVLDIFMPGTEDAVRVVFSFDEIENIKYFDPAGQQSTGQTDEIIIYPNREIIWTNDVIKEAFRKGIITEEQRVELLEFRRLPGEEYLFPRAFNEQPLVADYIGNEGSVFFVESDLLDSNSDVIKRELAELYKGRKIKKVPELLNPDNLYADYSLMVEKIKRKIFLPILGSHDIPGIIRFSYEPGRSFFGNFNYLKDELGKLIDSGYTVFVFSSSESQRTRIENVLKDLDVNVVKASVSSGFVLPLQKIIAIHENEIFGRKRRVPSSIKKAKSQPIDSFVELNPGDFIVHVSYGIGKYLGIDRIKAANTERDYIQIEYADEENIFIPIEQVNLIQRYIGSEGGAPRLDRLGGKSWETRKNKVKKAAEEIAHKLIEIYSRRKHARGYAFAKDTEWQNEFEAAFPFDETEDQLTSIEEIKSDMESPTPMDRLLCGDVGYGKTEVAMRAAFKAASGGKQVAYLAPTTILVEQHYNNFKERFANYPVNIGMMSRFVSKRDQKEVVKKMNSGEVDIVIGTHRLLQKDISFKNLGLMIIDEEQRFGVKAKERMKDMKSSVDCLTLSATPIPRTLHMSLLKIRDMSVLKTPPHNRRPIETFVQEFSEEAVVNAVRREVERGGQVYYLHNRIQSLESIKLFLQKVMPEIIVETAHGKLNPSEIEDVMKRFVHHGIHVLVSTTIIENGIDIPNVNTIIIDRADMYGISQLYQLRGRVGRSDRLAYAYLLYPEQRALSELAMKRLQIISDNTELGSGFKIALKDLEVRGAGNLLGKEQSGEIASVGFDMYLRLIDEAVRELDKKEGEDEPPEVYLDLDYSGYIPESYIKDQLEKMEIYKSIAAINSQEELDRLYSELEDRFGPLPDEVESLMSLAEIRIICRKLYISSMKERKGFLEIEFAKVSLISADKVILLIKEGKGKVKLDPYRPNILVLETDIIGLKEKSAFIREKLVRFL